MTVSTPVPDVGTPVFDAGGYINPVWHSFFFTLLNRTGGDTGIDASAESLRITGNTRRISSEEALGASMVTPSVAQEKNPQGSQVFDHGVQFEPFLHALVTTETDGFMSAADKLKLDGMQLYEAGTWSPALTFAVPGNLAVTYTKQLGTYVRFGNMVSISFEIVTASVTYSTSSGLLLITGSPVPNESLQSFSGSLSFEGLTLMDYTQFYPVLDAESTSISIAASASDMPIYTCDTTVTSSGSNITLTGTINYFT